jgi:hypothetical protein
MFVLVLAAETVRLPPSVFGRPMLRTIVDKLQVCISRARGDRLRCSAWRVGEGIRVVLQRVRSCARSCSIPAAGQVCKQDPHRAGYDRLSSLSLSLPVFALLCCPPFRHGHALHPRSPTCAAARARRALHRRRGRRFPFRRAGPAGRRRVPRARHLPAHCVPAVPARDHRRPHSRVRQTRPHQCVSHRSRPLSPSLCSPHPRFIASCSTVCACHRQR